MIGNILKDFSIGAGISCAWFLIGSISCMTSCSSKTILDLRKVLETAMWIGVDREKANQRDIQPIHLAAANGHGEILQHLLNAPWKWQNTVEDSWNHGHEQHEVLFVEHFSMLKWFLDMFLMECAKSYDFSTGCLVFVFFPHDCFSPHLVTFQRFPNISKKRPRVDCKERADVNLASKNGATPLYLAAAWERTECLIHLLDARAKVTQLNKRLWSFFQGFPWISHFWGDQTMLKCMVNWREFPLYNFRCLVWVGNVRTSGWKLNLHGVHPRKLTAGIWKNWKNTFEKASTNTAIRWGFILLFRDVRIPHLSLYIPWTLVKRFLTTRCKVDHF